MQFPKQRFPKKRLLVVTLTASAVAVGLLLNAVSSPGRASSEHARPTDLSDSTASNLSESSSAATTRESTLAEVLEIATEARAAMVHQLESYTARFVKQEATDGGQLGEETEIQLKVQTRFRNGTEAGAMRAYLRFTAPDSVRGREVIWAEDLHDGKLLVHEAGLLGLAPIPPLDPNGFLAMRGQRYPISEIGIVRLVEKLIERGQVDLENPDIKVTITPNFLLDEVPGELIQVTRAKPAGTKDDFSLAEIVMDPKRQLILRYRSFGWPKQAGEAAPLQESYTYHDIQTNVGLTDLDFDPTNPEYGFP
ncbi:hypothetical protein Pla52o_42770 [Novipirellula galeiformis]|uniref:DUF1571 domain-containing protein n=1 Tax=Novipirellula galeiformis TaxID=2528004 RepID=A0A5C6C8B9_9BACT|nr:DUF1571 domain-containing protein [Novipirellula galeiformis]TWU20402.1 hypothetical protein Pla52o_42770 [Novipirellula galeiformis]